MKSYRDPKLMILTGDFHAIFRFKGQSGRRGLDINMSVFLGQSGVAVVGRRGRLDRLFKIWTLLEKPMSFWSL